MSEADLCVAHRSRVDLCPTRARGADLSRPGPPWPSARSDERKPSPDELQLVPTVLEWSAAHRRIAASGTDCRTCGGVSWPR